MRKSIYRFLMTMFVGAYICMGLSGCGSQGVSYFQGEQETFGETITDADDTVVASEESSGEDAAEDLQEYVPVYVCGAVRNPGVYYLSVGSIKQDALNMAGGFADGAAMSYINLAEQVTEGEQIYFPYESDFEHMDFCVAFEAESQEEQSANTVVHLNTATKEQLMSLSGIGESKADAILAYRTEHGRFSSIEELLQVSGIGEGIYDKIKDNIVLD
ncbi:MAG: helix-hairpin-helix domain-containing protein [Lachnospiraceae bacterium]|nr:helix-hairpin-helix domain-containing protein [Lachnospiraceae bacterium]